MITLQTELNDTKSCYQLIKTMTKFEKEFLCFPKKKDSLTKCKTTACAQHVFCPLTQTGHAICPFNCPTTLSNYKHDTFTVLFVLKSG